MSAARRPPWSIDEACVPGLRDPSAVGSVAMLRAVMAAGCRAEALRPLVAAAGALPDARQLPRIAACVFTHARTTPRRRLETPPVPTSPWQVEDDVYRSESNRCGTCPARVPDRLKPRDERGLS